MKNILFLFLGYVVILCSCRHSSRPVPVKPFPAADLVLIKQCIDSTLQHDKGLNRMPYQVDFGGAPSLSQVAIDSFLKLNPVVKTVNSDSLMRNDTLWVKYGYFKNSVIRFEKIVQQRDGTLLVKTFKVAATDGAIEVTIILRRKGEVYECISSEITSIS